MEPERRLHAIEVTAAGMATFTGLDAIDGTGGTEGHQRHQGLSVEGEEGGEIFLPALRQQGFQTGFLLHQIPPCLTFLSGRGFTGQAAVMHLKAQDKRVPGGGAVVEHAAAQPPDHQGHGFLWLLNQFGLNRQCPF